MRRRSFLKSLGLAIGVPAWVGMGQTSRERPGKGQRDNIRVLTCNVRVDAAADKKTHDNWEERKSFCGDIITAQRPDLVGFQEMQPPHFNYMKGRLDGFRWHCLYNPGKEPMPLNAMCFRAERFELISSGGFWISEEPHVAGSFSWESANSRFVNWVDLAESGTGRKLRFWNTHLDHVSQKARENGAVMIAQACKPLGEMPQVLTGDFNAGASNTVVKLMKQSGWADSYTAVHGPEEPGFTGHGFQGAGAPAKRPDGTLREKIDWILCRGAFEPKGAEILKDNRNGHYPSDHFFVSAELAWAQRPVAVAH